jgi:flagellum-specific ATP synthase
VTLSRRLAQKRHYPAIDVLQSVSRVMIDVVSDAHMDAVGRSRSVMATYSENEDLINIGAYVKGSSPEIDRAIAKVPAINRFLQQGMKGEHTDLPGDIARLQGIVGYEEVSLPSAEAAPDSQAPQAGEAEAPGPS